MAKNPVEFLREVRQEASKVTWPGRRETMVTTAMVFAFAALAAFFFLAADQIISFAVRQILGMAG
jgi:preprotein translocase subunit SecE